MNSPRHKKGLFGPVKRQSTGRFATFGSFLRPNSISPEKPPPCSVPARGSSFRASGIRYRRGPPTVRDAFSEAFGVKNRLLRYQREIGVKSRLLVYRIDARYRRRTPGVRGEFIIQKRAAPEPPSPTHKSTLPPPQKQPNPTKTPLPHKSQKADRLTSANPQTLY